VNNPLLRFERFTEAFEKTSDIVENKLNDCFTPYETSKMPETKEDLQSGTSTSTTRPPGWNEEVEKTILNSMSFGEYDMLSCPLVALFAVSTTDADPMVSVFV